MKPNEHQIKAIQDGTDLPIEKIMERLVQAEVVKDDDVRSWHHDIGEIIEAACSGRLNEIPISPVAGEGKAGERILPEPEILRMLLEAVLDDATADAYHPDKRVWPIRASLYREIASAIDYKYSSDRAMRNQCL